MTQKFTYKDFTYELDEKLNHKVTTEPETKIPEVVYKYYSASENSFTALQDLKLYCTHPYSFNDSVDSSELLLDFENLSVERFKNFHERMLPADELKEFDLDKLFEEDKKVNFYKFRNFAYNFFSRNIGLISLTTMPFNILMWSHYTNETGFVLEFETEHLLRDVSSQNKDITNYCLRPVQYVDKLEFIKMFSKEFTTPDIPLLYATTIKRKEWKYEEEWRLSIYKQNMGIPLSILYPGDSDYKGQNDRFFRYSKDTIQSISVGKHFFSGKNCEKLIIDNGVCVTLFEREDEKFQDSDSNFIKFVNHIHDEYNDKLYMSGEYEDGKSLLRSLGKINLKRINYKTFRIIDLKKIVIKD